MNDEAQTLFQQGVQALRERKDRETARKLLTQSLRLDPRNDMAWLWLSQTTNDPRKRLKCIQSALDINPRNEKALALKHKLWTEHFAIGTGAPEEEEEAQDAKPRIRPLTTQDTRRIEIFMKKAETCLDNDDPEGAVEQWVNVLNIEPDNELALRNAVRQMYRLRYADDAEELIWRAIEAGTTKPSIYLTGIEVARKNYDGPKVDALYEDIAKLPDPDGKLLGMAIDHFINDDQPMRAKVLLEAAIEKHPDSPKLLRQMGDLYVLMQDKVEANLYYDRAARAGRGTKEGKAAEKMLGDDALAVLTDQERGSLVLAWREALGFGLFFIVLGWQDAGLNFARLGQSRILGIALSIIGGYLVITATSSPQQQPLAKWLGGKIPDDPDGESDGEVIGSAVSAATQLPMIGTEFRVIMGMIGLVMLGAAFWLVFNTAIHLLFNPVPVFDPLTVRDVFQPEIAELYYGG